MTAREYIVNELNVLVNRFSNITFKYKFDKKDFTHIIFVEPLTEFKGNEEYMIAESDLVYVFDKSFPNENILFISSESLITIDEPDEIIKFRLYFDYSVDNQKYIIDAMLEMISGENNYALAA